MTATKNVCTSHSERLNLSLRMHTRLTNGHSKSWFHHECMMALFFAWYSFCRVHQSLKTAPAHYHGLTDYPWSIEQLLTTAAGAGRREKR